MSANAVAGEDSASPARPAKQRRRYPPKYPTIHDQLAALTTQLPGEDGCLQWRNTSNRSSYPLVWHRGSVFKASHIAWILANGVDVPAGMNVNHHCDNKFCVRADHLYIGTQADNIRDVFCRQRWGGSHVKLSHAKAHFIRTDAKDISSVKLAKVFGVSAEAIRDVRRGRSWVPRCIEVSDK